MVLLLAYTNHRFEVESMKASLLGCGEMNEAGRGEGEMGTVEERFLYEYNLTLIFSMIAIKYSNKGACTSTISHSPLRKPWEGGFGQVLSKKTFRLITRMDNCLFNK